MTHPNSRAVRHHCDAIYEGYHKAFATMIGIVPEKPLDTTPLSRLYIVRTRNHGITRPPPRHPLPPHPPHPLPRPPPRLRHRPPNQGLLRRRPPHRGRLPVSSPQPP